MGSPIGLFVIALTISSLSAFCSRSSSLIVPHSVSESRLKIHNFGTLDVENNSHCLIHLLRCELAVNLLHSLASLLHRQQGLVIDVGGFDRIDLCLERLYLCQRLFLRVFVCLFTSKGSFGGYIDPMLPLVSIYLDKMPRTKDPEQATELS